MTELQSASSFKKTSLPVLEEPKGAHVVADAEEAIAIAKRFAASIAGTASERDREQRLPIKEIAEFTQSGLWSLNVPKEYGGPDLSYATIAEVVVDRGRGGSLARPAAAEPHRFHRHHSRHGIARAEGADLPRDPGGHA